MIRIGLGVIYCYRLGQEDDEPCIVVSSSTNDSTVMKHEIKSSSPTGFRCRLPAYIVCVLDHIMNSPSKSGGTTLTS